MPPKTSIVTCPTGLGKDVGSWLADQGLPAQVPCIRSSDLSGISDPFAYYLVRRLGLRNPLKWSKALIRGSWFHTAVRCWMELDGRRLFEQVLGVRMDELNSTLDMLGVDSLESRLPYIEREQRDALTAWGWMESSLKVLLNGYNWLDRFHRAGCRFVAFEPRLWVRQFTMGDQRDPLFACGKARWPDHYLVAQPDAILYRPDRNTLHLIDYKTTSSSCIERLSSCPVEFQTIHYVQVAKWLADRGILQKAIGVPQDATLDSFEHVAIRKPAIEFCGKDRDYTVEEHVITRGERKGQVEIRRNYCGEPRLPNYVRRVGEWMLGTGHHEELANERATDPAVNISTVPASICLDDYSTERYTYALAAIRSLATAPNAPGFYPSTRDVVFGEPDALRPFRLSPPQEWPSIAHRHQFSIAHRDDYRDFADDIGGVLPEERPWDVSASCPPSPYRVPPQQ